MKNKKVIAGLVFLLFFGFITYVFSDEMFTTSSYKVSQREGRNRDGSILGYEMSTTVDYFKIELNGMDYLIITNVRGGVNYINLTKDIAEFEYYKRAKK